MTVWGWSPRGQADPAQHPAGSQLSPWLRLSPSGGLVSVLPSACPPSLQTVPVCLALAAGWSRGRVPGPPVHNGSLFAVSLPARPSPALAIIPISRALSLLLAAPWTLISPAACWWPQHCCPRGATSRPVGRGHQGDAAGFPGGKLVGSAKLGWLGPCWITGLSSNIFGTGGSGGSCAWTCSSWTASPVPLASPSAPANRFGGCTPATQGARPASPPGSVGAASRLPASHDPCATAAASPSHGHQLSKSLG